MGLATCQRSGSVVFGTQVLMLFFIFVTVTAALQMPYGWFNRNWFRIRLQGNDQIQNVGRPELQGEAPPILQKETFDSNTRPSSDSGSMQAFASKVLRLSGNFWNGTRNLFITPYQFPRVSSGRRND